MALAPHLADTTAQSVRIPIIAQRVRDSVEWAAPGSNTVMTLQRQQLHMAYEVNVWRLQLMQPTMVAAVSFGPTDENHDTDDDTVPISSPDTVDNRAKSFRRRTLPFSEEYREVPF